MIVSQKTKYDEGKQREGIENAFILSALDDFMLPKVTGETNVKEAWDILKLAYQGNVKVKTVRLQTVITQFQTFKMIDSKSVDQFITKVTGIVN